jgi:hydrogenase expression/formation protein HypC
MCLAIPGQVLSIEGDDALTREGRIAFGGVVRRACLAYVPEVHEGDYVLVHAGFAISVIDQDEAMKTLAYLAEFEPEDLP